MTKTERKLDIYEFGRNLIETRDLDPVYVLAWEAYWPDPMLVQKWLVSYWCFYHVGTASWILDQRDYWDAMLTAARSKSYPRSAERRHFRGSNALSSVLYLQNRDIDGLFNDIAEAGDEVQYVMRAVQKWTGFGPWIAFKVADMVERLDLCAVDFSDTGSWLYDSPREAAAMLNCYEGEGEYDPPHDAGVGQWAIDRILSELGEMKSPPRYERTINAQEAETILCKWKSYMNGHYHVGEDIAACRKGLLRFSKTPTAQLLLKAGKRGGLW